MRISPSSAVAKSFTSTNTNHTLISRSRVASDLTEPGYPYERRPERWRIIYLPGGLRYASADAVEFQGSFVIQPDDPYANGFAGRLAGGGWRLNIYGNKRYGSGYPNATAKSVKGRGLPFFFYPIRYGRYPTYGPTYIYDDEYGNDEYGGPGNKHRPGGRLYYITIQPPKSLVEGPYPDIPSMTLYVVADEPTLKAIKSAVQWRCSRSGFTGWFVPDKVRVSKQKKFKGPAEDPNGPVPEQAVSYYRGSSVALFLVGYNNTAQAIDYTFQDRASLEDTPLPPVADTPFFQCINVTLGESIPLVITMGAVPYQHNAASSVAAPQTLPVMLLVLVLVIWRMPIW